MLSRCANPQCSKPFLRLGQGRLFLVETGRGRDIQAPRSSAMRLRPGRVERYWLCDQCAPVWTLVQDRNQGITPVMLSRPPVAATAGRVKDYKAFGSASP